MDPRPPAGRQQQVRAFEAPAGAILLDFHGDLRPRPGCGHHRVPLEQFDAIGKQCLAHDFDELGIVLGHDLEHLDDTDPRTEAAKGLGQLAADGPATHDEEMLGQPVDIEDRLVGEIGKRRQSCNRGYEGGGSAGDDEAPGPDARLADRHFAGARESAMPAQHGDAEAREALLGIVGRDGGDDTAQMGLDLGEVDERGGLHETEGRGAAMAVGRMGGRQQRF